jgi:UDP-N-acetyl-D-galactosamine dehydrogenase
MKDFSGTRIAVLGLGYVGLPLAVEFAKYFEVIGFDINEQRVRELGSGHYLGGIPIKSQRA